MSTSKSKLQSKNALIVAILTIGNQEIYHVGNLIDSTSKCTTASTISPRMMSWSEEGIPHINGSGSLANKTSNFINENVRLSLSHLRKVRKGE